MLNNLQGYVNQAAHEYDIPAISLAIWKDGRLSKAASGILNLNTGAKATTDSIFQIGSITKVSTTSLIMHLVEEEYVVFDKPVKYYLRNFQVKNKQLGKLL